MTFTYDGADLSKTIKYYYRDGNSYYIEFLDGTSKSYESDVLNEEEVLESVMLKQAVERRNAILEQQNERRNKRIKNLSISLPTFMSKTQNEVLMLSNFCMSGHTKGIGSYVESVRKIHELKKYEMYLEIYTSSSSISQIDLLNSIEFDHIYQIPLTINSLDRFSYDDIKGIYKNFVKTKTSQNN